MSTAVICILYFDELAPSGLVVQSAPQNEISLFLTLRSRSVTDLIA